MKHPFDGIDTAAVVSVIKGVLYLHGKPIGETQLQNLKQEAKVLKTFYLWHILQETVKQEAIKKGINESTEWEHTLSAKMMLHNLGIIKSIVDVFDVYTIPQVAPPKKSKGIPLQ